MTGNNSDHAPAACSGSSPSQRIVLVLQGGGALGAYQAGVYQALHEAGIEPDWIIGTSIGAINAALIAGNKPDDRLPALDAFWQRMAHKEVWPAWMMWPLAPQAAYLRTLASGIDGFFEPNAAAFCSPHVPLGAEAAGYYSTLPLKQTIEELVDFSLINSGFPRMMVGAAHVRTSRMHYFDSRAIPLDVRHVMASGALPPAFPAVRIDGELYWDGGILSNTPTEAVFDDYPRYDSLIFAVHVWNPAGEEPNTIWDVLHRQKDIQYSSRVASHIARQQQMHQLRNVIEELATYIPAQLQQDEKVRQLIDHGCPTHMHVVRLLAPRLAGDDHTKDVDFDPRTIATRWSAGYAATKSAIADAPWQRPFSPIAGVTLHEPDSAGRFLGAQASRAPAIGPANNLERTLVEATVPPATPEHAAKNETIMEMKHGDLG